MLKAIIFDYNGVLVDDLKIQVDSYFWAAKKFGYSLSRKNLSQYISYAPKQKRKLWFGDISEGQWEELYRIRTRYYLEAAKKSDIVFPDVEEVLISLSTKYTLALLSNTMRNQFEGVFPEPLARLFRETLFVDEVEIPKPSPEPLLRMLNRLGIRKDQCCYVGDSVVDIQMSRSAGIYIFASATGHNSIDELKSAGADVVLTSLSQLEKRLEGAEKGFLQGNYIGKGAFEKSFIKRENWRKSEYGI